MEKKEFFRIFNLMIAILIIIMALMPCSIPGGEKDLEITLDGISSPIETIDQIDNGTIWVPFRSHVVVPTLDSEMAGDDGNLYAPDILMENGIYKMWYGAQSSDGHDSIHFATSDNGRDWLKYGVTIPTGENNHVNDPSVVKVNDLYYMYYTVAPEDELDEIWAATSENGLNWTLHGMVLNGSSDAEQWDSLKVGRPSVLYEEGVFKMWFDGSQRNATNPTEAREGTGRHVGFANSSDGLNWTKFPANPVFNHSGAIDVENIDGKYIVLEESRNGVFYRVGDREIEFPDQRQPLFEKVGDNFDKYGHVTPFILKNSKGEWVATYTGAAPKSSWAQNRISVWYPIYNFSLSISPDEPGNGEVNSAFSPLNLRGFALSRNTMRWTLDPSYNGTQVHLTLTYQNELSFEFKTKIRVTHTRLLYMDEKIHLIRF